MSRTIEISKTRTNVRKTIYKMRKIWYNKNGSESFRFFIPYIIKHRRRVITVKPRGLKEMIF